MLLDERKQQLEGWREAFKKNGIDFTYKPASRLGVMRWVFKPPPVWPTQEQSKFNKEIKELIKQLQTLKHKSLNASIRKLNKLKDDNAEPWMYAGAAKVLINQLKNIKNIDIQIYCWSAINALETLIPNGLELNAAETTFFVKKLLERLKQLNDPKQDPTSTEFLVKAEYELSFMNYHLLSGREYKYNSHSNKSNKEEFVKVVEMGNQLIAEIAKSLKIDLPIKPSFDLNVSSDIMTKEQFMQTIKGFDPGTIVEKQGDLDKVIAKAVEFFNSPDFVKKHTKIKKEYFKNKEGKFIFNLLDAIVNASKIPVRYPDQNTDLEAAIARLAYYNSGAGLKRDIDYKDFDYIFESDGSPLKIVDALSAMYYANVKNIFVAGHADKVSIKEVASKMQAVRVAMPNIASPTILRQRVSRVTSSADDAVTPVEFDVNGNRRPAVSTSLVEIVRSGVVHGYSVRDEKQSNKTYIYDTINNSEPHAEVTCDNGATEKIGTIRALGVSDLKTYQSVMATLAILRDIPAEKKKTSIHTLTLRNFTTPDQILGFTKALYDYAASESPSDLVAALKNINIERAGADNFKHELNEFLKNIPIAYKDDKDKQLQYSKFIEELLTKRPVLSLSTRSDKLNLLLSRRQPERTFDSLCGLLNSKNYRSKNTSLRRRLKRAFVWRSKR